MNSQLVLCLILVFIFSFSALASDDKSIEKKTEAPPSEVVRVTKKCEGDAAIVEILDVNSGVSIVTKMLEEEVPLLPEIGIEQQSVFTSLVAIGALTGSSTLDLGRTLINTATENAKFESMETDGFIDVLKISKILGVNFSKTASDVVDAALSLRESEHIFIAEPLIKLSIIFNKPVAQVLADFEKIVDQTRDIEKEMESQEGSGGDGMANLLAGLMGADSINELKLAALQIGVLEVVYLLEVKVEAKVEANTTAKKSFAEVITELKELRKYLRLAQYTPHEQISVLKAKVFKGRPVTETYPLLVQLEALSKERFGVSLSSTIEVPAINLMILGGLSAETVMENIQQLVDSGIHEENVGIALLDRILLKLDSSLEAKTAVIMPVRTK